MWVEKLLWWLSIICAGLLLPSWHHAKTVIAIEDVGQEIQGWGWQDVASWAGVFGLIALVVGRIGRSHFPLAVTCACVAIFAFAGAAAEAARAWIDLPKEPVLYVRGRDDYSVRPATGMNLTMGIAIAGAICSSMLLATWFQQNECNDKVTERKSRNCGIGLRWRMSPHS